MSKPTIKEESERTVKFFNRSFSATAPSFAPQPECLLECNKSNSFSFVVAITSHYFLKKLKKILLHNSCTKGYKRDGRWQVRTADFYRVKVTLYH